MTDLQVTSRNDGLIALSGALNRKTVVGAWANAQAELDHYQQKELAVSLDLAGVDHVDTAGLAWLLDLFAQRQAKNQTLSILNTPVSLLKLAKISNVNSILPLQ